MIRERTGTYITTTKRRKTTRAFVPSPLPLDPPLVLTPVQDLLGEAHRGLGALNAMAMFLPNVSLLRSMCVRQEAVCSARLDGVQSSLSDVLMHENDRRPEGSLKNVKEVARHIAALEHGLRRIREDDISPSLDLLKELHEELSPPPSRRVTQPRSLRNALDWKKRTSHGGDVLMPPPGEHLDACLANLEDFVHDRPHRTPPLLKAALAYAQFHFISPFTHSNGRLGRTLAALVLIREGVLHEPLLPLSWFFARHMDKHDALLQSVRDTGDWEEWLAFFLEGVVETSREITSVVRQSTEIFSADRQTLSRWPNSVSALAIHKHMKDHPILSIQQAADAVDVSDPTASTVLRKMEEDMIVHEMTGQQRNRLYAYSCLLDLFKEWGVTKPSRRTHTGRDRWKYSEHH